MAHYCYWLLPKRGNIGLAFALLFSNATFAAFIPQSQATASKDTVRELEEVVVSSQYLQKDVKSTAPLYNLSSERMKLLGVTDLADALHRLPGVVLRDYGGAGGVKTVSVRGFGAQHTGVIYDGIQLSDCQSGRVDLSRYSLDNVGSLSMVVGDNSDIFISAKAASSAATVVISSMSVPSFQDSLWRTTAQLRVGSFGLLNPYLKVGRSVGGRFSFSTIGEFTYSKNDYPFTLRNGMTQTQERRKNSRMKSGHVELNGRYRLSGTAQLEGKAFYYDNGRELPGQVVLYNPVNNEYLRERNFFSQLSLKSMVSDKLKLQGLAKFNWDASFYRDVNGKYPGGQLIENYFQREYYLSGSALYQLQEAWSVNYAADCFYNSLTGNDPTIVNPTRLSLLQTAALKYGRECWQLMGRALWSVYKNRVMKGDAAKDASKFSPSVSMSFQPSMDRLFFLRASYKNIFRMPTFNESYYFRMGSIQLKPEDTEQVNIGATWQRNGSGTFESLMLTADCYANRVRNKIVAIPQNMYLWSMTNLDRVRSLGLDATTQLSLRASESQRFVMAGNYSFQRVQPRTNPKAYDYNKQVAYIPKHSGAASLSWLNPWADCVLHAVGVSNRYATSYNLPVSRVAGYVDLGLSVMRSFVMGRGRLNLRGDMLNVFNTQYEIVTDYPMPGRNFRFTISFEQ